MRHDPGGMMSREFRTLFEVGSTTGLTDGQLLERFATRPGEAAELAFEALVERHGSMVFRACRSILRDDHEAMDAFQATFLVLARKGRGLWVGDSLGPWLHRVACRAALKARTDALRRRALELRAAEIGVIAEPREGPQADLVTILHEELDRLPARYRAAIVLCDLQGHTCEETARRLGCAVGTVGSRLSRGRERLRARLTRRGLAPTAGLIAMTLTREALGAAVPPALVRATVRDVLAFPSGQAAAGASSATVALLVEDVLRSLIMTKIRSLAAIFAMACGISLVAVGTIRSIARGQSQEPDRVKSVVPPASKPAAKDDPAKPKLMRHKDAIYAMFGNMRPLIESPRGVRFQSREVILYRDGTVKVYKIDGAETKDALNDEAMEPMVPPLRHDDPIRDVNIFNDEKILITSSDNAVKVWDGLSCELKKSINGQFIRPLFFSWGLGGRFTSIDLDGKVVTLWDAKTLEPVGTIRVEGSPRLIGAGLSKDGRTLATIGEDHSVTLRDAVEGKSFATLRPPTPPIARVFVDAKWTDQPVLQLDDPFWEGVKSLIPAAETEKK